MGFLSGSVVKNPPANAGDREDALKMEGGAIHQGTQVDLDTKGRNGFFSWSF